MRLRTQLVLAAFLLAIVPLTAIVLYSYSSSRDALESAYRHEAARLTKQMDSRLASIRTDLETRLADVSSLPLQKLPDDTKSATQQPVMQQVVMAMGDIAPLVDSVEFRPEKPDERAEAPEPPEPAERPEPIVIDLPSTPLPHFTMPAEYHEHLDQIRTLSRDIAMNSATMTREERDAKNAELQKLNQELQKSMQERSAEFNKAMAAAIAERQRIRDEKRAQRDREREARQQPPDNNGNVAVTETTAAPEPQKMIRIQHALTNAEKEMIRQRARQVQLLLGHDFAVPVESDGRVVGHVAAQVSPDEVIRRVLGTPNEGEEEI